MTNTTDKGVPLMKPTFFDDNDPNNPKRKTYIEREALIDEIDGTTWYHISCQKNLVEGAACEADALYKATDIYNVIKSAPSADVVEVRHGEWIETYNEMVCSKCHLPPLTKEVTNGTIEILTKYCPNCSAKMDGKVD